MERKLMNTSALLAKHLRDVHFGGNWTFSNLKDQVTGLTWQQATTQIGSFNTIARLVYHIHYFVQAVLPVLQGGTLDAHDKFSFDHPPIRSQQEWEALLEKVWADAEHCAALIEQLPEDKLPEDMADPKYGSWQRNILGIIEHSHYHLGQIAIVKKLVAEAAA